MQTYDAKNAEMRVVGIEHRGDLHPLTEDEVQFEIDMCIGCDRCMRACPVPMSSIVNIADLNRATISDEIAPHVAQFTDECVMCGSCVSVCPVDNHRDLLMLSLKQRLGIPWDGTVDIQRIFEYLPSGWDIEILLSRLRGQPMFSDPQLVPENYLLHLFVSSKILSLLPGTTLVHEGEFGRNLFLILQGNIELSSIGQDNHDLPIAIMRPGEYMGEHAMLTGQQYYATARAQTPAVILAIPEQAMQRMMEIVPAVRHFFEQLGTTHAIETILKRMVLFQGVSAADIRTIAEQALVTRYDRNECLFGEDAASQPARESLHILLEGFVKVARRTAEETGRDGTNERIIAYRQGGDYFAGGLDLLGDRRAVTATTITRVSVAEVSRQVLLTLFTRYPEVTQRFKQRLQLYRESLASAQQSSVFLLDPRTGDLQDKNKLSQPINPISDAVARAGLHAIVEDGVIEGTEVLVIDLDKCIHCNECEEACARRHGHSRMNRKGMVVGNISIATACRQCQDPVCMLCSRAGIARLPSGEVYITESCIGCGICAERCPYDNISIMTLADEDKAEDTADIPSNWERFSSFFAKGTGKERGRTVLPMASTTANSSPDAYGEMRKKVAIKCDLCAGYNNQACVQACPTGAAIRVQPETFFGSTEEILRRRVQ